MAESAPNPELLNALGRLVRGLSALFWGLPIALVVCFQTAQDGWLRPLGIVPPIVVTGLLFYGLGLLSHFQRQERIWRNALERGVACSACARASSRCTDRGSRGIRPTVGGHRVL